MLPMNTNFIMVNKKIRVLFLVFIVLNVFNVRSWIFSNLRYDFLQQNIYIIAQQLNWLFTKKKAKILACITVRNFLILCKACDLYQAFLQRFSIWSSNVSSLPMIIPQMTKLSSQNIQVSSILHLYWKPSVPPKIINLHFFGFRF